MDDEYSALDDKELCEKLLQTDLANRLLNSPEWGLLKEARDRIINRAIAQFVITDVTDIGKITELKVILKKYKYGLFSEIEQLAQEGELAFEEAKERSLIKRKDA